MSRLTSLVSVGLFFMILALPLLAQEPADSNAGNGAGTAEPLSPQSLDALTAGIALYPDKTIEAALSAAMNPQEVSAAAALSPEQLQAQGSQFDSNIQYLATNAPELLTQLAQHLSLTTSLGIAAQTQLNDVWASVDRVRAQYQQSTNGSQNTTTGDSNAADSTSSSGNEASEETGSTTNNYNNYSTTTTGGYGSAGAFAAGLVAGNTWQDLYRGRPYYPGNNVYHNGNNVLVDNHNRPGDLPANRIGGAGGVNGIGGVGGLNGVGGVGGVNGVGRVNTARPNSVPGGNADWVNGLGNNERNHLATNTWGQMDNQARQSFTGRNGSPANFNGSSTARPNGNANEGGPFNSKFGGAEGGPSQGKLSPNRPSQPNMGKGSNFNASPSRSFGGPGGGGNRGGGRR